MRHSFSKKLPLFIAIALTFCLAFPFSGQSFAIPAIPAGSSGQAGSREELNQQIEAAPIGEEKIIELTQGFDLGDGIQIYGGRNIRLVANSDVVLTVTGNTDAHFHIYGKDTILTMTKGVTLTRGSGPDSTVGGVYVTEGTFNMEGGKITGLTSADYHAGAAVMLAGATFNMSGGEITGNEWDPALSNYLYGGIIYSGLKSSVNLSGDAEIDANTVVKGATVLLDYMDNFSMSENAQITGNTATTGGGVYMYSGSFNMSGGEISGNTAEKGGGVYLCNVSSNYSFSMTNGQIKQCIALKDGGGIYAEGNSDNSLCVSGKGEIIGNHAENNGGGIYVERCIKDFSVVDSISGCEVGIPEISGNSAQNGGGIYFGSECSPTIDVGKITNNHAEKSGGGIYVNSGDDDFSPTRLNCSNKVEFSGNSAGNGAYDYGESRRGDNARHDQYKKIDWKCVSIEGTHALNNYDISYEEAADRLLQVFYDKNGADAGDVPHEPCHHLDDKQVTVLPCGNLSRAGYTFSGWNTSTDGTGTAYAPGQTFTLGTDDVTLYAQWKKTTLGTTPPPSPSPDNDNDGKDNNQNNNQKPDEDNKGKDNWNPVPPPTNPSKSEAGNDKNDFGKKKHHLSWPLDSRIRNSNEKNRHVLPATGDTSESWLAFLGILFLVSAGAAARPRRSTMI
ncbi:InlB B-repeat-containing protein [Lactovum odontotermitis]